MISQGNAKQIECPCNCRQPEIHAEKAAMRVRVNDRVISDRVIIDFSDSFYWLFERSLFHEYGSAPCLL